MKLIHARSQKKIVQLILLLLLVAAIPFTVFLAQRQQQTQQQASTANCGETNNLIRNCDLTTLVNFDKADGPDWRDVQLDPERNAGSNQYTRDNKYITKDGKFVAEIGRIDNNLRNTPKINEGFRIRSGIIQSVDVNNANTFNLSFDLQLESSHTYRQGGNAAAPFYVWTGFQEYKSDGKEVFLAYTPHNDEGEDFFNEPIRADYVCEYRPDLRGTDKNSKPACNDINTTWKRISVSFTREELCGSSNQNCIANAKRLFISFGATNNFNTIARVTNVVLTTPGVSPQPTAPSTPTPTLNPQAQAVFYFTKADGARITSLSDKPGDREILNVNLDTKSNRIIEFEVKIIIPNNWTLDDALLGSNDGDFDNPPVIRQKTSQLFYLSKINLNGVAGNLQLAKLKLTAKSIGIDRIKFEYTEAITATNTLKTGYLHLNYTISTTTPGGGTPPTVTTTPGAAGTPGPTTAARKRTKFTPIPTPCSPLSVKGINFSCFNFAPAQ